jgi:hypothetical protein
MGRPDKPGDDDPGNGGRSHQRAQVFPPAMEVAPMPNPPQTPSSPDARPAEPAAPKPPADPDVYGSQWGDSGGQKPPAPRPPDRPDKIKTPPEKN